MIKMRTITHRMLVRKTPKKIYANNKRLKGRVKIQKTKVILNFRSPVNVFSAQERSPQRRGVSSVRLDAQQQLGPGHDGHEGRFDVVGSDGSPASRNLQPDPSLERFELCRWRHKCT